MNNIYEDSVLWFLAVLWNSSRRQEGGKKYEVRVLVPVFHAFKPTYSNNILVLLAPGTILSPVVSLPFLVLTRMSLSSD